MAETKHAISKVYFENLNAIRFIAAFMVIVPHVEQIKSIYALPNYLNYFPNEIGKLGVTLFFVLSGFLISYLLFKEQELTQTINIRYFFLRRILRIWPLYFLIILSALFIFPSLGFFTIPGYSREMITHDLPYKLILYVLFLPNLVSVLFGIIPYASQAWSIGAEEQFYLVWPFLNKYVKNKWGLMLAVIFMYMAVKYIAHCLPETRHLHLFINFWESTPIDCMAIGGLFALINFENTPLAATIRRFLFYRSTQVVVVLLTIGLIAGGFKPYFFYEFYSLLFGMLIINFASNKKRLFSMENKVTNYLGKISYGLYMYHSITIVLCIKSLQYFNALNIFSLYLLVFITTFMLSAASYEFFEKRFINRKIKYSNVISGDNAKEEPASQN